MRVVRHATAMPIVWGHIVCVSVGGKDQPICLLERGIGFALPARGISFGAVVVKATDEWMRSICRRAGAINFKWRSAVERALPLGSVSSCHGRSVGTRFLHQKTRKVLPYVSHFFGCRLVGCRALARGRKSLGDTMGIAVVFDSVTVHRYHPFRLVGAFLLSVRTV